MNTIEILKKMAENLYSKEYNDGHLMKVLLDLIGGVSIINLKGEYIEVNQKYANTCGYEPIELEGSQWIKTVYEEDINIAKQCYYDMVEKGMSELSFRGIRKDGTIFKKHIILVSKFDLDKNLTGHYCFMKEEI